MSDIEKMNSQMKFDTENLAMPEIHVSHQKSVTEDNETEKVIDITEKKVIEELSKESDGSMNDDKDEIDFSGAIPEIHFHKKNK